MEGRENGLGVFRWVVGEAKMVRASEKKRKKSRWPLDDWMGWWWWGVGEWRARA